MGEHLIDFSGREFKEGKEFTHTFVWGSVRRRTDLLRADVSNEFLKGLEGDEVGMSERMSEAGEYPTEYSIKHDGEDGAYDVELLSFEDPRR